MTDFFCIGDSHITVFSGYQQDVIPERTWINNENFWCFRTGPHTAFSLGTRTKDIQTILEFIPKKSNLIICYGEIDCRVHIPKVLNRKKVFSDLAIREISEEVVDVFLSSCESLFSEYGLSVLSITPPNKEILCGEFSSVGTFEERQQITAIFNETLKEKCCAKGYNFINIYNKVSFEQFMDNVHLSSQKCLPFIKKELRIDELCNDTESF